MADAKTNANILLAAWLAEQTPNLFNQLAAVAGAPSAQPMQLSGFTDILSSIGSTVSNAAKSVVSGLSSTVQTVGSFLSTPDGQKTLSTLIAGSAGSQPLAAQTVLQQAQLAQQGQLPANVQLAWDPSRQQFVPTGNVNGLNSFMSKYGLYLALGGVGLLALFMLRK